MNNMIIVFICLMFLMLILFPYVYITGYKEGNSNIKIRKCPDIPDCNPRLECPACPSVYVEQKKCEELPNFVMMIQNMAKEHNYTDSYNCDEYAKESRRRMKDYGYETYYCTGRALWVKDDNNLHAFNKICLYYEPINAYFPTPIEVKTKYDGIRCE